MSIGICLEESLTYYILQVKLERSTSVTPAIWNENSAVPVDEEIVSTIGYGTIDILTLEVSDVLLEVLLPVVNQEVCSDTFFEFAGLNGKDGIPSLSQPLTINSYGQDDVCRRRE